jgi:hypothetical protein
MKDEHYRTGTLGMWEGKEFKFYRLRTEWFVR